MRKIRYYTDEHVSKAVVRALRARIPGTAYKTTVMEPSLGLVSFAAGFPGRPW